MSKDLFSEVADSYARYRPVYPKELYEFIYRHIQNFDTAWDCATGNGQIASVLAASFNKVYATDISKEQLHKAVQCDNIEYSVSSAEDAEFPSDCFDLITVGQAAHWFDMNRFNSSARRCLKPGGVIALTGYTLLSSGHPIQFFIDQLYRGVLGKYWDPERQTVDNKLVDIPFPFIEIPSPDFFMEVNWNLNELCGYLLTWSAVKRYKEQNTINPIEQFRELIIKELKLSEEEKILFSIPFFLRLGLNEKI